MSDEDEYVPNKFYCVYVYGEYPLVRNFLSNMVAGYTLTEYYGNEPIQVGSKGFGLCYYVAEDAWYGGKPSKTDIKLYISKASEDTLRVKCSYFDDMIVSSVYNQPQRRQVFDTIKGVVMRFTQ